MCTAKHNHMKGHNWGIQVENESDGDMTISIVYYLIEKTGRKLQNCLVNSQELESCRILQCGMADCCRQMCAKMLKVDLCIFL